MISRPLSYWEQSIGIKAIPNPERAVELKEADILIIGAGFCGSWLAYFLKQRNPNLKISIIERDFFNLGASARNAGFLSCGNISEWQEDLQDLGWDETLRTLCARIEGINIIKSVFGSRVVMENCGSIDLDPITAEKTELMNRFNSFLDSKGYSQFFHTKDVQIGKNQRPAFFNRFDSSVNPCHLLLGLHKHLIEKGVQFVWQSTAEKVSNGEALVSFGGSPAHRMPYKYAFICTNAFSKKLNPQSDIQPARGQVIVTSACRTDTQRSLGFLRKGYDYFRFVDDGRVLVGGGRLHFKDQEDTDAIETSTALKEYLIELAYEVIGHRDFKVDFHWSGIMGLRKGRHASLAELRTRTQLDAKTEELSSCGGWGVTLTPYITRYRAEQWE